MCKTNGATSQHLTTLYGGFETGALDFQSTQVIVGVPLAWLAIKYNDLDTIHRSSSAAYSEI